MKTIAIEYIGWGVPWTEAVGEDARNSWVSSGLNLKDSYKREALSINFPLDVNEPHRITAATSQMLGLKDGVFTDLYITSTDGKWVKYGHGQMTDVDSTGFTVRFLNLTYDAIQIHSENAGTNLNPRSRIWFSSYIPRISSELDLKGMKESLPAENIDFYIEPILVETTAELNSDLDVQGGVLSTTGFSFEVLYEGLPAEPFVELTIDGNIVEMPDKKMDRKRGIETLLSNSNFTWEDFASFRRRIEETSTSNFNRRFAPFGNTNIFPVISSTNYVESTYELYNGNVSTDLVIATSITDASGYARLNFQQMEGMTVEVIPDVYGGLGGLSAPQTTKCYPAPPSSFGRVVRIYEVEDVNSATPFATAKLIHIGYLDDLKVGRGQTSAQFSTVSLLAPRAETVAQRLEPRNQSNKPLWGGGSGSTTGRPLQDYAERQPFRVDTWDSPYPFDIYLPLTWDSDSEKSPPQWVFYKGFAFPHIQLCYSDADITDLKNRTFEHNSDSPFAEGQGNETSYVLTGLVDFPETRQDYPVNSNTSFFRHHIIKTGVPIDPDENFSFSEIDLSLVDSNLNFVDLFDLFSNRGVPMGTGYLQIPARPSLSLGTWDLSPPPQRVPYANSLINRRAVTELVQNTTDTDFEPCHVFIPTEDESGANKSWARRVRDRVGITNGVTPASFVSLADILLQVLLSTGGYKFNSNAGVLTRAEDNSNEEDWVYKVEAGPNTRFDVLPEQFGLGIHASLVDVDQILNFQFSNKSIDAIRRLYVTSAYMMASDDPTEWLEENILQPFALALVTGANGKIRLESLVSSTPSDIMDTITEEDLVFDDITSVPLVAQEFNPRNLLVPAATIVTNRDVYMNPEWRDRLRAMSDIANEWAGPRPESHQREIRFIQRASSPSRISPLRTAADQKESVEVKWNALPNAYVWNVIRAQKSAEVKRWGTQSASMTFVVSSVYPDYDKLHAGQILRLEMPNVAGFRGERGLDGLILVSSVSNSIRDKYKHIEGYIIDSTSLRTGPPVRSETWALAVPILSGGATDNSVFVDTNEMEQVEWEDYIQSINFASDNDSMVLRILDENCREISSGFWNLDLNYPEVAVSDPVNTSNAKWLILDTASAQNSVFADGKQKAFEGNAYINEDAFPFEWDAEGDG